MFEELIEMSLQDSQRVLLASINNGLFELYLTSFLVEREGEKELIANLTIEQYALRQDNGEFEFILLDDEVVSKQLSFQVDCPQATKTIAKKAIVFVEEFCKEFSLQYYTL